jgi:hypothetical protein
LKGYKVINLKDIYNIYGEIKTKEILKDFKCEINKDVEYFIHDKAIEFSKQDLAKTFLVITSYKQKEVIVGYFAITNKGINIKSILLSNTKKKKILRYALYDHETKKYIMALPLIGQLGKNYNHGYNKLITGDCLLKIACDKVREAQDILGGRFVFLECEDKEKLRSFYENNGFVCFGKRNLERDERKLNNGEYLLQMLCYLKDDNKSNDK